MKPTILTAILAGIFSLYGVHQPTLIPPPSVPAQAVVAATALSTSNQPSPPPVVDLLPPKPVPPPAVQTSGVAQFASLQKQFSAAVNVLANAISLLRTQSTSTAPNVQSQLDALQRQISQTNRITNLSNVTITSPSFSGVTTDNIPEGSNLYFTAARADARINSTSTIGTLFSAPNLTSLGTISNLSATNATTTSLTVTSTSTLTGISLSNSNCSSFGNGGKLTTDAFGNVVCAADQGGSGSTVAGANTQVQFNDAGGFGANAAFAFDKINSRLTITNASTTNISASGNSSLGNATSTSLFSTLANFTTAIANTFTVSVANIVGLSATNSTTTNATTTNLYAASAVIPSLSATNASFSTATTSNLAITSVSSSLLKTSGTGVVVPAIAGTDYVASTGGDWTGTFGTHAPSYYLDARNLTNFTTPFATALHATTTDALSEGATNLYFTNNRVASVIAGTTTDALAEGTTNKYFTNARAQNAISVSGSPLTYASGVIGINQASGSVNGFLTSTDWTSFNNKIASSSLSGTAPITYNSSTGAIGFDFAHSNTWTGLQAFANITATNATTTSFYITGIASKLLKTDANGQVAAANAGTDYQAPITSGNLTTGANLSVSGGTGAVIGSGTSISLGSNVVTGVTNDTNVTGSIAGNNLTLGWTGLLGALRGGTGSSTLSGILKGNGTGPILSAVGGTDYEFPLTFSSPLSRTGNAISFLFNTANTWTGLNQFQNGASTTRFSSYGPAYFGATATSSFDAVGNLNLVSNGLTVGTNQLVVSGGKVGIGTTTPFALLSVSGGDVRFKQTTDSATALVVENAAGTATLQVSTLDSSGNIFEIASSTGTAYLDVTTAGNVGVGSTTPSATFGLVGSHYLTGGLGVGALNTNAGSIVATATTTALNYIASGLGAAGAPAFTFSGNANTGLWSPSANALAWSTNGSERIRLDASGNLGIGTTTPGSIFSINGIANWTGATSTIYSTGGINLSGGCFAINGTCVTGGGGGGSVTSITAGTGLTGGTITSSGTIALDLTRANTWTGLQQFSSGASSTLASIFGTLYVGGTATSTVQGNTTGTSTLQGFLNVLGTNSTSTFSGGLTATYLNLTGSSATSTAANGINLSGGCFAVNGTCVTGGGGGSGTVGSGTTGQLPYYAGSGTTLSATSSLFLASSSFVGIGTTSPGSLLSLNNIANFGTATSTFYSTGGINLSAGCFSINGNCVGTGGTGNPAGSNGQVQFNSGGSFGASANFFWDSTNNRLGIGTSTPFAKFAIHANNGETNTKLFEVASSTATATTTLFQILNDSRVAIGTTTAPAANTLLTLSYPRGFQNTDYFIQTSCGTSTSCFTVNANAAVTASSYQGAGILPANHTIGLTVDNFVTESTANSFVFRPLGTWTTTSGTSTEVQINPTYNETSGTAENRDLDIFRIETAIGSGPQYLLLGRTGGSLNSFATSTKFSVDRTGSAYFASSTGIGTTTPWRTLSVTGSVGFDGLTGTTGAGSLCLSANKEVVYNSGSDNCLSSLRATKHDIQPLNLSALNMVKSLQPVAFIYNNDASSTIRYGFIAEDTASVDSHLATYDASGAISGVDDRALLAIVTEALQTLIGKVSAFADSFTTKELTFTRATGDDIVTGHVHTQELCIGATCVTEDQLKALLAGAGQTPAPDSGNSGGSQGGVATSSPDGLTDSPQNTEAPVPTPMPSTDSTDATSAPQTP